MGLGLYGEEYNMDFIYGNCQDCGREQYIGNWKVREKGMIKDIWLCNKCGDKLERKIKSAWKRLGMREGEKTP
jgi:hypothetical protein